MTREEFAGAVIRTAGTVTEYEWGGSGPGGCDCVGLIIGAVRSLGVKWPGTHGTNWLARNWVKELRPVDGVMKIGDLVFKAREPGEERYALPDTYAKHPDQRDYYHVGVVTRANPLEITHCTSVPGGIQRDTKPGQWKYRARLECVKEAQEGPKNEGGGGMQMDRVLLARVHSDNGGGVNFRSQPIRNDKYKMGTIPEGAEVDVLAQDGDWSLIEYNGKTGYAMSLYLLVVGEKAGEIPPEDTEPQEPEEGETVQISFEQVETLRRIAQELLDWTDGVIGHG